MVIEVTSAGSRREDQDKKDLYARLGVEEYFLDDPLDEYLTPALQGYRLVRGKYEPIAPEADGSLLSRTTGLLFRREERGIRLIDAETREPLLRIEETQRALQAAQEELARFRRNAQG